MMGSIDAKAKKDGLNQDKKRLLSFIDLNSRLFESFRLILGIKNYTEVTEQILNEVSGNYKNHYGISVCESGSLGLSAGSKIQMQLETMVLSLGNSFFHIGGQSKEADSPQFDYCWNHSTVAALKSIDNLSSIVIY